MTKKIAVSLPDRTLARAKAVVRSGRAESVSGYIARLIDQEAEEESFQEMIDRWNREDGRSPELIRKGEAKVRADFARAGLVVKVGPREKKNGKLV
jgi:hypothetical protein